MVTKKKSNNLKDDKEAKARRVFGIAFVGLFCFSIFLIISSFGDFTVTGQAVQKISRLDQGTPFPLEAKEVVGLDTMEIKFQDFVKNGKVVVENINASVLDNKTIANFSISTTDTGKVEMIKFNLKISRGELASKGLTQDLAVYDGEGNLLPTEFVKETVDHFYYAAISYKVGNFSLRQK